MTLTIILAIGYPIAFLGAMMAILDYLRARDAAERAEREKLIVHIQAPAQALSERAGAMEEMVPAVTFEDDVDYWESKGIDVTRETR